MRRWNSAATRAPLPYFDACRYSIFIVTPPKRLAGYARYRRDRKRHAPRPATGAAQPLERPVDREDHDPVDAILPSQQVPDVIKFAVGQEFSAGRRRLAAHPSSCGAWRDHHRRVSPDPLRFERSPVGLDQQPTVFDYEPHRCGDTASVALEAGQA
jgi:hypothetical protein